MIPADHWHDNGDGTAWVVGTEWWATTIMREAQDRPCDTCDGKGWLDYPERKHGACDGTGRHTFTVEVERVCPGGGDLCGGDEPHTLMPPRTLRVSVVPNMVLPIVDNDAPEWCERSDHHIGMGCDEYAEYNGRGKAYDEPQWLTDVSLPPDAKPGMWAVKLEVHS